MTTAAAFFKDLTLPTMPEVASDLIRSLNEDDVPLAELREAIARDPALAVQLLRIRQWRQKLTFQLRRRDSKIGFRQFTQAY